MWKHSFNDIKVVLTTNSSNTTVVLMTDCHQNNLYTARYVYICPRAVLTTISKFCLNMCKIILGITYKKFFLKYLLIFSLLVMSKKIQNGSFNYFFYKLAVLTTVWSNIQILIIQGLFQWLVVKTIFISLIYIHIVYC